MAVYIKNSRIYNKFKEAETENRVLFISAPCGYGKSAAFQYYYRRKPFLKLCGRSGKFEEMPAIDSIRQSVVLFDDICFLTDEGSKQYVIDMIYHGQKTIVLIGRGALPVWLVKVDVELSFIRADKYDLMFQRKETLEYLKVMGYDTTLEMADHLTKQLSGYPLLIMLYTKNLEGKVEYSHDVYRRSIREMYHYYDDALWDVWIERMKQALLATCEFDIFTVELIERITGF